MVSSYRWEQVSTLIRTGLVRRKQEKTEGRRQALHSALVKEMGKSPWVVGDVCPRPGEESSSVALKTRREGIRGWGLSCTSVG